MRHTLEELKAMSDKELVGHWAGGGHFPFDMAICGECLTLHASPFSSCHPAISEQLLRMEPVGAWLAHDKSFANTLRKHIEELYALRLFYDHLYPAEQVKSDSSFAAQSDLGTEEIALPHIDDEAEWDARANTR